MSAGTLAIPATTTYHRRALFYMVSYGNSWVGIWFFDRSIVNSVSTVLHSTYNRMSGTEGLG